MEIRVYTSSGVVTYSATPDGWVCGDEVIHPTSFFKHIDKVCKDFQKAEVVEHGKTRKFSDLKQFKSYLTRKWVEWHKDLYKHLRKQEEEERKRAREEVVRLSVFVKGYSLDLHNRLQSEWKRRFYDITDVATPVMHELEYRKGSSRQRLLELLTLLDGKFAEVNPDTLEGAEKILREYVMLFPETNVSHSFRVEEVLFEKLEMVRENIMSVVFKKKPLKNYVCVPVGKGYACFTSDMAVGEMFLGLDLDWVSVYKLKKKIKQKTISEFS